MFLDLSRWWLKAESKIALEVSAIPTAASNIELSRIAEEMGISKKSDISKCRR